MANWKNNNSNYNQYGQGQSYGGYQGPPQYAQPAPPPPKKSGAKYTEIRKGNFEGGTIVNAWNKSAKGLVTATVAPYHKSDTLVESSGKTGAVNTYMKMMASVKYHKTGVEKLIPCLMNQKTKVVVLQDLGMVITPNGSGRTASGKSVTGYFGTFQKR